MVTELPIGPISILIPLFVLMVAPSPGFAASAEGQFVNLGPQITSNTVQGSAFTRDPAGRDLLLTVMRGEPAKLLMFDGRTGEFLRSMPLDGAKGAWNACTASDGSVYVGTDNNGHLYRFVPGDDHARDLGQVLPEQSFTWDVAPGRDGEVFCGTYPGCNVVRYHPDQGFTDVGHGAVAKGENYVRGLACDLTTGKVYAGVGAHAHLVEVDPKTGEKTDILPKQYADQTFVYAVDAVGGKIFASVTDAGVNLVIDPASRKVLATIEKTPSHQPVAPPAPGGHLAYLKSGSDLLAYDLSNNHIETAIKEVGHDMAAWTWMAFDDPDFPGQTLVGMTRTKKLFRFNPQTRKTSLTPLQDIPREPTPIQTIATGPDGRIYSAGYLTGGVSVFDPETGKSTQLGALSQAEGICVLDGRIYFGCYPRARLNVYDPKQSWDNHNPRQFATLEPDEQDRPFGMLGVAEAGEAGKVFIGTVPAYGKLGGVLAIWDVKSQNLKVHRNIVPQQGIVSLVYHPASRLVIGGSTISGGLGIEPSAQQAMLFGWDDAQQKKVFEVAPVPDARAITALIIGPDGNVWGVADGKLFIFDPVQQKTTHTSTLMPVSLKPGQHVWRAATMALHPDGQIYGTMNSKFFRLDPASKNITILRESGDGMLTFDGAGRIYLKNGTDLWQYTPAK